MFDTFDAHKFNQLIPKLWQSEVFRSELENYLADDEAEVLNILRNEQPVTAEQAARIHDAAYEIYQENSDPVLTLGWDGDAPGMSGAVWIQELAGVYMVSSSDYGPYGPFESIDEALACECFSTCTANPELDSDELSGDRLLDVAHGVVDWENDGEILVNSQRYVVNGEDLVKVDDE